MSDLIHYQKNMVCLTTTEFDRVIARLEKAEKDLASANHRVTLLEEQLRVTESELKRALSQ